MDKASSHPLHAHQIVCLEDDRAQLYAEIIQVIPQRQTCWVRPTVLVQDEVVYPVNDCPDVVWPMARFRPAFDTEVIPLLGQLEPDPADRRGCHHLRQLLQRLGSP
ncbi:hypothetical protein [Spirulina major]|uniref:hypothetical protein n=1 Tax=Spirulina major TaxID=270636 RepID=UPI000934D9C8|nr:hypothetical protein [Spirulina major]